jgi:hypothetical protein
MIAFLVVVDVDADLTVGVLLLIICEMIMNDLWGRGWKEGGIARDLDRET